MARTGTQNKLHVFKKAVDQISRIYANCRWSWAHHELFNSKKTQVRTIALLNSIRLSID